VVWMKKMIGQKEKTGKYPPVIDIQKILPVK